MTSLVSVCNLHTAPFSKMAAINFPDAISRVLCSAGWISWCQTIYSWGSNNPIKIFPGRLDETKVRIQNGGTKWPRLGCSKLTYVGEKPSMDNMRS